MPAKLSPEPTVKLTIPMPKSMKVWLEGKVGGASRYVRELISKAMRRERS